jgi:type II secretory pathway component PulC
LVVKGIVYSDDRPAAVVGNDIVFEGDTVGGAKVVKINQDSVEFQTNEKKWTQKVER